MEEQSIYIDGITKRKLYWLMQVLGWFSLLAIEVFNFTFFIRGEFQWIYLYSFGIFPVIGIVTTHFYKIFFIKPSTFTKEISKVWGKAVLDVIMISLLMVFIGRLISIAGNFSILKTPLIDVLKSLGPQLLNIARYVLVWIIIYYLFHIMQHTNQMQKAKLEAENKAKNAELDLLKTQLNPTFLFQNLSSIKALVISDKDAARLSIIHLSELLRYSLNYEKNSLVLVEDEYTELNKYISLEKIRLGDQLHFDMQIKESILGQKIPTASLLNLVENAIRMGIEKLEKGGSVMLEGDEDNNQLSFHMIHNIPKETEIELSEGMENLTLRLNKIYGSKAKLLIEKIGTEQIRTLLTVPKI